VEGGVVGRGADEREGVERRGEELGDVEFAGEADDGGGLGEEVVEVLAGDLAVGGAGVGDACVAYACFVFVVYREGRGPLEFELGNDLCCQTGYLVFSAEPEERAEVDGYGGLVQSER
jgi:hypothetical protein